NRDERFATATDLSNALERQLSRASTVPHTAKPTVLTGSKLKTVNAPRRSQAAWVSAVVSLVVVLGLVGWYAKGHRGAPPTSAAPPQSAREHFRTGETALLNHNFPRAVEQYQLALDQKEQLQQRERELAHLGIAIAMHQRIRAEQIARQIERQFPGDPDLERIRSEFAGGLRQKQ